ncbi:SWR1-complex protein 3 [Ranunculus cassubicifolius]
MEVNYPLLPEDIIHDILKRISFGPWMMLGETNTTRNTKVKDLQSFCDLSTGEFHENNVPETLGRRCLGSSSGWLLTVGAKIHLLNPLTRQRIPLPSKKTLVQKQGFGFYDLDASPSFVYRFALSSRNHQLEHDGCVVMVIYSESGKLAFASPKSKSWNAIKSLDYFHDIVFFKGKFYAVNSDGGLSECNTDTSLIEPKQLKELAFKRNHWWKFYLFEMAGDLHLLKRSFETKLLGSDGASRYCVGTCFEVYKFDFNTRKMWMKVSDLGNNAVFIGMNSSFSVSSIDYPNIKPNSIYFMDGEDWYKNGKEIGIYDYKEKKFERLYKKGCPAVFFKPSFA